MPEEKNNTSNSRRALLKKAAWSAPIIATVSLPQHAQASIPPTTTVEPTTTVAPTTTLGVCDDTATATEANIEANPQGAVTDNGSALPTSPDVYTFPMGSVFNGGTVFVPETDGSLPDLDENGQEIADINATLIVPETDLPCFVPDQLVEVCLEVAFENLGPANTIVGGTSLSIYDAAGSFVAGSGTLTIANGETQTPVVCSTFTAADLAAGIIFRITAETWHQIALVGSGNPKSWNLTGSYTVNYL